MTAKANPFPPTFFLCCALLSVATGAGAQSLFRLADSQATPATAIGSRPVRFTALSETTTLFYAQNQPTGMELWRTDGTAAGTTLVRDTRPGSRSGTFAESQMVVSNGLGYFTAIDSDNGIRLWRTDGTTAGTQAVCEDCEVRPLPALAAVNDKVYFGGFTTSYALWTTDGTTAGTMPLKYFWQEPPTNLLNVNGTLFFAAAEQYSGKELWKSDGTESGTVRVKEIMPSWDGSAPDSLVNLNGVLLFVANDGVHGRELWKSDGTAAGTILVKDIRSGQPASSIESLTRFGDAFYFIATNETGRELWRTDGTPEGTTRVTDVCAGDCNGVFAIVGATDSRLYFTGFDGGSARGLWTVDSTGSISLVREIAKAGTFDVPAKVIGQTVYFAPDARTELWKSDGTPEGTVKLTDVATSAISLGAAGNTLLMSAVAPATLNNELWFSDGTAAGTVPVAVIDRPTASMNPRFFAPLPGHWMTFSCYGLSALCVTNGGSGTINYLNVGNSTSDSATLGSWLYYSGTGDSAGYELWRTDGTLQNTARVADLNAGPSSSSPQLFTTIGDTLYFTATGTSGGRQVWRSNGTSAGTSQLTAATGTITAIVAGADAVYIREQGNFSDGRLWRSTPEETSILVSHTLVKGITAMNGTTYFSSDAPAALWKTDGTKMGTTKIASFYEAPWSLLAVGSNLFFRASVWPSDHELWKSDGTAAGTVLLKDICPGTTCNSRPNISGSEIADMVVGGSTIFFAANDGVHGSELWKTDGTTAGTVMVKDICPGRCSSDAIYLTAVGERVYFQANDGSNGEELWVSDGSADGTYLLADLEAGPGGSDPYAFRADGNLLYLSAYQSLVGREPWVVCTQPAVGFSLSQLRFVAGETTEVSVAPVDASGQLVPCYEGSVTIRSSDPQATLPSTIPFPKGFGRQTVDFTLETYGPQTIEVFGGEQTPLTSTHPVVVIASPQHSTVVVTPDRIAADGVAQATIVVRLKNAAAADINPPAQDVTVSSTLGTTSVVTPAGDGTYVATLRSTRAGTALVRGAIAGVTIATDASVILDPGPAAVLEVTAPTSALLNTPLSLTVAAKDLHGNFATSYRGRIEFSSTDTTASLPPAYSFTDADSGVHAFPSAVSFNHVGAQTLSMGDGDLATTHSVTVRAQTTTTLSFSPQPAVAGETVTLVATVSSSLPRAISGTATFYDGPNVIGTSPVENGTGRLTASFPLGLRAITATFNRGPEFESSTAVGTLTVTVPAPVVTAAGQGSNTVGVSWSSVAGAASYRIYRSTDNVTYQLAASNMLSNGFYDYVQPNRVYFYRAAAVDATGQAGPLSGTEVANTIFFSDDLSSAIVRAVHVNELRNAIDIMRAAGGLGAASYSTVVQPGRTIAASDITEMRGGLAAAHSALGLPAPVFADPIFGGVTTIMRRHFVELRDAMK